jgi:phosphoglucomutase
VYAICYQSPNEAIRARRSHYEELETEFGTLYYTRLDAPATPQQKNRLSRLSPNRAAPTLVGEAIRIKLTSAPGNNPPIGGRQFLCGVA